MNLLEFLQLLENSSLALAIGEGAWLFPGIETVHVLGLALVMGSIAVVDLRLLGFAATRVSVKQFTEEVLPYTWTAFAVALVSGSLLFVSNATTYYGNFYFRVKLLLLLLAGINMLIFHLGTYRRVESWNNSPVPPPSVRAAGGLSLLLWIGILVCGRLTGFFL